MLIHEVCACTKLTKKAVIYYTEQGLVSPASLKNGYRDYSETDVARLQKVAVLRRLGLCTEEIRAVLEDTTGEVLRTLAVKHQLMRERQQAKQALLEELSQGGTFDAVAQRLSALEQNGTITELLLTAFPGYYGRFICLHFARFLTEPMETEDQRAAYKEVLAFLDGMPPFKIPPSLQAYLAETVERMNIEHIRRLQETVTHSTQNPQEFLETHRETLEQYLAYKETEEYRASPVFQIQQFFKQFQESSGYCEVFLPAMRRLSPAYTAYCRQLETANEVLLAQYPQAADSSRG